MGANNNGVIIKFYVESKTKSTTSNHHRIKILKTKAKRLPEPFKRQGNDRRSQLLAYAKSLRKVNGLKKKKPWLKYKKWRWSPSFGLRFRGLCHQLKKQRKYKNTATDEEVDCLLGKERDIKFRKSKATKASLSQVLMRLGNICLGLACVWQGNNVAEQKI